MSLTRRTILHGGAAAFLAAGTAVLAPSAAAALEAEAAMEHVRAAVDEVIALASSPGAAETKAKPLARILTQYAAMPQIARFAAGPIWREMNADQQGRFEKAFLTFLSGVYARRFADYAGQSVTIDKVEDDGRRGLRVKSQVSQPSSTPVMVDWLVSDRPGRVVIADIVIEGVSLLVTQREEVGAMLSARNGDVERLIADLAAS
ncbi:ABC transporter substrate-binding protein [Paralimibaculum aggregatum]|uniref:ABC transporter substrate-binding protein n=1 Tax=Paralimibaculum aggregatum TaxID=3036245 RepID=A0ABQ6LCH2_9RHOB|nr:ABC transporter substrate-binding protein [Limibaculum sp. NKW23]GMG81062.1 ABC transporter substrate-binding protein [Limibaculum sp. NKW23]